MTEPPRNPQSFPTSKVFSLKGLWGVGGAMGSVIQNSSFPLFLSLQKALSDAARAFCDPSHFSKAELGAHELTQHILPTSFAQSFHSTPSLTEPPFGIARPPF
jgi:hypothetical protein